MKTTKTLSLIFTVMLLSSCQFNQSVKKDLSTGAYSRGDGMGVETVEIEVNDEVDTRNAFVYGEKVNLVFDDVTGLTRLEDKVYPGLSMHIMNNQQDTVFSNTDLLNTLEDGTALSPLQLQAHFFTALPYKDNEEYKVKVTIWDKKGDGTFVYELPFTVKESDLLDVNARSLDYSSIYLWNETTRQTVVDHTLDSEHVLVLIMEGIEGMETIDEKVFPVFSIDIVDSNGNEILSNPNIFREYLEEGVNARDVKEQLIAEITFSEGEISNPCTLTAVLKDQKSAGEITVTTQLDIQ
jgi:hypothetical protein|tara:strand:- start:173546 stop:174430 length:885 start_codon:yes stop_codon:yes gene_type:complete